MQIKIKIIIHIPNITQMRVLQHNPLMQHAKSFYSKIKI